MRPTVAIAAIISSSLALPAAAPPDRINYQGVLRDATGAPRNGSFDMIFRLYDQEFGGFELLQDWHMAGVATPVVVTNGLFNVEIGSGHIIDGWGPGFYQTLGAVFKDYGELWLDIQISGEILSPRLRFASAGYAFNAGSLAGRSADEFLDTGPGAQAKSGPLTLSGASGAGGPSLTSIGIIGARAESSSGAVAEMARYGDGLWATSGPGPGSGGVFYAYGGTAVNALGAYTGGYFQDLDNSSWAYVANGDYGARIQGETTGAYIQRPGATSWVTLAERLSGVRVSLTSVPEYYVMADAGYFEVKDPSGATPLATAKLAQAWRAAGGLLQHFSAAEFENVPSGMHVSIAEEGGSGVKSWVGDGFAGWFVQSNGGFTIQFGDYGIVAEGADAGGQFQDGDSGAEAFVADGSYKIQGNGSVAFTQNHPSEKDKVIVYNAPEGAEVATYARGSARLRAGEARVELEETFALVTNPDLGLTAHLTPHGAPVPLAVESLSTTELVVRAPADAPPDLEFDYLVYGLRIGFEETSIVQEKKSDAFIPSMASHRKLYEEHPELRPYNALERAKRMRAGKGLEATPDLRASTALREAIHEFDPTVDKPAADSASDLGPGHRRDQRATAAVPPSGAGSAALPAAYRTSRVGASPLAAPAQPGDLARADAIADPALRTPLPTRVPSSEERFRVSEPVRAGELLAIDPLDAERVHRAEGIADPRFIGVAAADSSDDEVPLATSRVITVWADAASGAIVPGDLLTTSPAPGLAMRAVHPAPGTVLGKALDPLESGTGEIRVLWMPH